MDTKGLDTKELDAVLTQASCDDTIRFFGTLNEADRKALAPRVLSWWTANLLGEIPTRLKTFGKVVEMSVGIANLFGSQAAREASKEMHDYRKEQASLPPQAKMGERREAIRTAILSCCSLSEIKKEGTLALPSPNFLEEIIKLRRPKWLPQLVTYLCDEQQWRFWAAVRSWEKLGLVSPRNDSAYLSLAAVGIAQRAGGDIASTLRQDTDLINQHAWRLLADRETLVEMTQPMNSTTGESWQKALLTLSSTNEIDRFKLLEATIAALAELGNAEKSSSGVDVKDAIDWVVSIHDGLSLETDEHLQRIDSYLALFSTRNSYVLLWVLEKVELWWQEGLIPPEKLLAHLGNVFVSSRKDPAIAALKVTKDIAAIEKNSNSQVLRICLSALDHASQDVQKRAIDLIEKYPSTSDSGSLDLLKSKCDALKGLNKQRLSEWIDNQKISLGTSQASASMSDTSGTARSGKTRADEQKLSERADRSLGAESEAAETNKNKVNIVAFELRAKSVKPELASVAGIDNALNWFNDANTHLNSLKLETEFPRLDPSNLLKQIDNIDDLIYLCLQVLEENANGDDLELVLDGIARLNNIRAANFQQRTSALRTRALKFLTNADPKPGGSLPYLYAGPRLLGDVAALIIAWTDGFVGEWRNWSGGVIGVGLRSFVSARLYDIAKQVAANNQVQLLSMPTHRNGWLDPMVFASRVIQLQNSGKEPALSDATQALLRLAPDHRSEALEQIRDISSELAEAYRYALGEETVLRSLSCKAIWIAASRARFPHQDDPKLREKLGYLGPDTISPATYNNETEALTLDFKPSADQPQKRKFRFLQAIEPGELPLESKTLPTALLHVDPQWWYSNMSWEEQYIWPQNFNPYFSRQIRLMVSNFESSSPYLLNEWEPLFDSDVPMDEIACWLIALGLSAKLEKPQHLALDALIQGIDDGRIVEDDLVKPFGYFFDAGIRLSNWARALHSASRSSPLHLLIICKALEYALATLTKPEVKLVELYNELSIEAKQPVTNSETRDYLSNLSGTKSVKLAKSLLSLQADRERKVEKAAAVYALEKRLERAERWQRRIEVQS